MGERDWAFQLNYNMHTDDDWNGNVGNNGNSDNHGNGNGNTSTGGNNDNNGNANGNTNNTGGSQNQSGILFPVDGEVSELEAELIDMIKTTGKEKSYELVEYINDVNREHVEVLMELNINGIMDTAYSYGNERLTNERFTDWTGYYTYDPRGSVTGVTDSKGMIWQSYRYNVSGDLTFGKPQYNNVYSYNAESYNPNMESQYLRARYYNVVHANFLTEDSYLGNIVDPLTLNRYNYGKSSPLNYVDPLGFEALVISGLQVKGYKYQFIETALHDIDVQKNQNNREDITWIVFVADEVYNQHDIRHFNETAEELGINIEQISTKKEFINYINSKSKKDEELSDERKEDLIDYVSVFAHGQSIYTGSTNQLSFGYKLANSEDVNFKQSDISSLMDDAFDKTNTVFYSCNAGTADTEGKRFAQEWSNKTGGLSLGLQNARTNYAFINSTQDSVLDFGIDFPGTKLDKSASDGLNKIAEFLGLKTTPEWDKKQALKKERKDDDDQGIEYGYPKTGSLHYPSIASALSDADLVAKTFGEERGWILYAPN